MNAGNRVFRPLLAVATCGAALGLVALPSTAQVFSDPRPAPRATPTPRPTPAPAPRRTERTPQPAPRTRQPEVPVVEQPSPYAGSIPRAMVGEWSVRTRGGGLLKTNYLNVINIQGAEPGQMLGRIVYYVVSSATQPSVACSSMMRLVSVSNDVITAEEVMESGGMFCPGDKRIEMQMSGEQLWVTWTKVKRRSSEVTMQGWAQRV